MIVKWPGVAEAGSVCGQYLMVDDLFPSILEMAGVTDYAQIGGTIDGVSFVPLLKGTPGYPRDRALVWHFPHCYGEPPYTAIRRGAWKLIYFHADQHYELYNIEEDIGERMDLSAQRRSIADRLGRELRDFLADADAVMPIDKNTGRPVPFPGESPS
jgi:arylsulfatase A-like enzyme